MNLENIPKWLDITLCIVAVLSILPICILCDKLADIIVEILGYIIDKMRKLFRK